MVAWGWRCQWAVVISRTYSSDTPVAMSTPNLPTLASDTILQGEEPGSWERWPIPGTGGWEHRKRSENDGSTGAHTQASQGAKSETIRSSN